MYVCLYECIYLLRVFAHLCVCATKCLSHSLCVCMYLLDIETVKYLNVYICMITRLPLRSHFVVANVFQYISFM